jgi:hypothetical protein
MRKQATLVFIILIALALLIAFHIKAQTPTFFYVKEADSLKLSVECTFLDTLKNPEDSLTITTFQFTSETDSELIDITEFLKPTPNPINIFVTVPNFHNLLWYGFRATDPAGNVSTMHYSTDPDAAGGGWLLMKDLAPPQPPKNAAYEIH